MRISKLILVGILFIIFPGSFLFNQYLLAESPPNDFKFDVPSAITELARKAKRSLIITEGVPLELTDVQAEQLLSTLLEIIGKKAPPADSISGVVINADRKVDEQKCKEVLAKDPYSGLSVVNASLDAVLHVLGKRSNKVYLLDPNIRKKVSLLIPCIPDLDAFLDSVLKLYKLSARKLEKDLYLVVGNDVPESAVSLIARHENEVEILLNGKKIILRSRLLDNIQENSEPVGQVTLTKREVNEAWSNLSLIRTQARAVPFYKEGKPTALRLFAVRSDEFFYKLGFRNGDLVFSINGESIAEPSQTMQIVEKYKNAESVKVQIERGGAKHDLEIKVVP